MIPAAPSTSHEVMQLDEAQKDADAVDREKKFASLLSHPMMRMNRETRRNKMN